MKRKLRILIPVVFASIAMAGCDLFGGKTDENSGYYKGYNLNLKGQRLEQELQKLCFAKHVNWVQYGQVNTYYKKTEKEGGGYRNSAEAIKDGSEYNEYFYTGKQDSGHGTREHVWPCANSAGLWDRNSDGVHQIDKDYYVGGGSDLFHIRTCNSDVNTARGNSKFCNFKDQSSAIQGGVTEITEYGGKYSLKVQGGGINDKGKYEYADLAEPNDKMKGDVARIILYVYIHYKDRGITPEGQVESGPLTYHYSDFVGGLNLTRIMGYSDLSKAQKVLKEWNELDPPSTVEKTRNNTVQRIQGNRNPLVDHPELVNQLF